MSSARTIRSALRRAAVIMLVLIGIGLMTLNIALIAVGIVTGQIMNPAYGWLMAGCLSGWIIAFALAGVIHLVFGREARPSVDNRCAHCGYNLRGHSGIARCPECGRSKFGDSDAATE